MNNTLRFKLSSSLLVLSSLFLNACDTKSSNYDFTQDGTDEATEETTILPNGPIFDPSNSIIPSTNDLLFAGSADGTLNIPNDADEDGAPDNPIIAQVNQLDGFSTTNPITIGFGVDVDPVSLGDGVRVFHVTKDPTTGLVIDVVRELTGDEIVAVQTPDKQLAIIPKIPLNESSSYMVVLTKDITDTDGNPVETPAPYFLAKGSVSLTGGNYEALEALRPLINNMEEKAVGFVTAKAELEESEDSLLKDDIIMSWSFTTQSISAVLNGLAASAEAGTIEMARSSSLPSTASSNIYEGTLDVPYYLEEQSESDPTAPLTGYWKTETGGALTRYAITPKKNSTLTIPVIMTTPQGTPPDTGWPIIIYQHGITRVRTDILAYADNMASNGFSVIAIDLPLHGVDLDAEMPSSLFRSDIEPSDIDLVNNTTGAPGADGTADDSGTHFMNLQSLLTSRDNIRQGVSNLLVLRRSLAGINIDNDEGTTDIDPNKVGFVAHSLGGIVGIPYLAVEIEDNITPSSLLNAGVGIRAILLESDPFGTEVKDGLEAAGITGADYDAFLYGAQFILESADPVNYSIDAAASHPLHIVEMIGDKVVVNSTTEYMAVLMDAESVSSNTDIVATPEPDTEDISAGIVRFTEGNHSTVLDPTRDADGNNTADFSIVYKEIHDQIAGFQTTYHETLEETGVGKATIEIKENSVIQQQ